MFTQVNRSASIVRLAFTVGFFVLMQGVNAPVVSSQQITTTTGERIASVGGQTMHSGVVQQSFDGHWWEKAGSEERIGFLYALDDCLTYDFKPPLRFDDTWINYEQKISHYYASAPANRDATVESVFRGFGKEAEPLKKASVGERYGNEFWRAHSESARRGFIEGYVSCRTGDKHAPKWSRPVEYYLQRLDDMYNGDDRHGEKAPEYTGSVASALEKLRESP